MLNFQGDPFVMKKTDSEKLSPNDRYEGFAIDLIGLLQKKIENFEYNIYLSPGNKFGSIDANGNWDGMVGELLSGVHE